MIAAHLDVLFRFLLSHGFTVSYKTLLRWKLFTVSSSKHFRLKFDWKLRVGLGQIKPQRQQNLRAPESESLVMAQRE